MSDADATTGSTVAVLEPGYTDYVTERTALEPRGVSVAPVAPGEDAAGALDRLDPVAILVRERPVTAALIERCPSLRLIVRYGVGVDSIDLDAARERRVFVANVPDYGAMHEVSDHAVGLYLAVARRIVSRDAGVRRGAWGIGQAEPVAGHRGATVGLLGYGRIARKAREKFMALGFTRCLVCDPGVTATQAAGSGFEITDIDSLCRASDVVSLHAPLNESTRHIIDANRIALMKPGAIVINVARGGLVDEHALADALNQGRLFGAGVDVFEDEPPSVDHPLMHTPNTVLSDHTAWYSEFSVRELQQQAAEEVVRVLDGDPPQNWVNRW